MTAVDYTVEIVGGKHDGVVGLSWCDDDGKSPPVDRILVGTCEGRGACSGGNMEWCRQASSTMLRAAGGGYARTHHVAYWLEGELEAPVSVDRYRLTHIRQEGETRTAVYVQAGVTRNDPRVSKRALTVQDIIDAKPPDVPAVTALGRELVEKARLADEASRHRRHWPGSLAEIAAAARRFGLSVSSGLRTSGEMPSAHARPVEELPDELGYFMRPRGWSGW